MNSLECNSPRIAKVIARAGICSRRDAEKLILAGRVTIDGEIISTPAIKVTDKNIVLVDGKRLQKEKTRIWLFHKPKGVITTNNDPQKRKTVFDILPKNMPRVISIGRLDLNTEGLLLLTNDGEVARSMERSDMERRYRVRVYGHIDEKALSDLRNGIIIDGIKYEKIKSFSDKNATGKNSWITMIITEGKNREIRRICEHIGLSVNRLIRTDYGQYRLGNLERGNIKEISL